MTDQNKTAIAILVDHSGSMQAIRSDAEGAINAFLESQAKEPGECTCMVAEFDTEYDVVTPTMPIKDVPKYVLEPRGGTALLDGIGKIVTDLGADLKAMPEDERPGTVIVVVQTDGQENSSREWKIDTIRDLLTQQREKYGWTFIFLGADENAVQTGVNYGFSANTSMAYGTATMDSAMSGTSAMVSRTRAGGQAIFTQDERDASAGT